MQPASLQDPTGGPPVVAEAKAYAPELQLLWGDGRYGGPTVAAAAQAAGLRVEVVATPGSNDSLSPVYGSPLVPT